MIDKDKDFVSMDKVKEIISRGSQSSRNSENNDHDNHDNRKKDSDKSNNNK